MQAETEEHLYARARAVAPIAAVIDDARQLQRDVYLVGGTVRDLILGRAFLDVDLALDGEALELATAIGVPEGTTSRFGTLSVQRAGYRHDIARTRAERYPRPGALPEVTPARIETDLSRRDFTVNALALGLAGARAGELLAVPGALEDLRAGRLAVLHDRSFLDDPTRLLRLARYSARLGFEPAAHTQTLAAEAIAGHAFDTISGARIGNELRLLAAEPDPVAAFESARRLGLPWTIDPELARRALEALPAGGRADLLVLALALAALDAAALQELEFTAGAARAILEGRGASALAARLAAAGSNAEIARAVGTSGIETVALASGQGAPSQSLTWLADLRHRRLQITGDDLIEGGIPEGPRIGHALQAATDALMDGRAADRESQLRVALKAAE